MRGKGSTILLVEDDRNDAMFMKMAFESAGVTGNLQEVRDGKEALEYLKGEGQFADRETHPLPYLLLLDLKLPHVMGMDVLKWVRQQPELNGVVVLVLTSSSNPAEIDTAYRLGANAFLVKPSSFQELQVMAQTIKDFWLVQNQPAPAFQEV
ncbi:MAG TPA: response regulator [Verrucomicrobiae bacterium]|nr:response regulator [Verrucomicrobiae bacterium]